MSAQSLPVALRGDLTTFGSFELGYRPILDGVRGVAILAVLSVHTSHLFGWSILKGGSVGVDIFFVLSGFLITCLLLEEWNRTGGINLKNFYVRRGLRLVPALTLVLATLLVLSNILFSPATATETRSTVPIALFYLTDFSASLWPFTGLGALRHTWSLAMEEHFYLLWPPVLLLLLKSGWSKRTLVAMLVSLALLVCFHRAMLFQSNASVARTYYGFDTRVDALLIGCVAAMGVSWGFFRGPKRFAALGTALIGLFLVATDYASPLMHEGGFTILAATTALVVMSLVFTESGVLTSFLELKPLVWVGRISYGVYLWHYPVFKTMNQVNAPWPVKLLLGVFVTFAIASLSFYGMERPLLRLKKRFA
jgi:peptidoglycan/LPS O-acetylase OafA/YrhL